MPFISIIIPTRNNEEHIAEAITNCLNNHDTDYEIIIINDASTDQTLSEINRVIKSNQQKITVITVEKNIGPGPARNIGISQAKGEYLMFLDADDWFEPQAIDYVAKKLRETQPDVLMFNHQRVWNNGIIVPNIPNKYVNLENKEKDISEPEQRRGAIRNLHCPWNKAYKLDFIKDNDISFPEGFYEDVTWSIESVLLAKTLFYIPAVIINYRQRWGSITRKEDERHFNIFKHLELTITLLNNNPEYKSWYGKEIYQYARSLLFGIIGTRYRIEKKQEALFLKKTSKLLHHWRKQQGIKDIDIKLLAAKTTSPLIFKIATKLTKK